MEFPSGQRGQTVNLLVMPSKVRILLPPPGAGVAQLARASAFQAEGRGFEPRLPLIVSQCSSEVERFLGKEEATGSIPVTGSTSV